MHGVRSSSSVRPTRGVLLVTVAFLPLVLACSPGPGASPPGDVTDVADAGPEADLAGWVDTVPEADALAEVEAPPEADALPETDVPSETGPWTGWTPAAWPLREMIGVASHMDQGPDPSPDRDFEFAHYAELGGGRIRQNMRWNKVEPADDQWRLDLYATQVSMAAERGIPLLPQVGYDVDWAKTGVGDSSLKPDEYAEYTARVASEFCWWIKDFECWNEENITRFWEPAPDAYRYGLLLKAAYPAIKAACPGARVSIGGLASYSDVNLVERWAFLRELYEAHPDIANYFDVLSLHPYTWFQYAPPEQDQLVNDGFHLESQSRMTEMAREILAQMGKPDAPIFFTEVGWPTYDLSEDDVARFAARSVLLAARDGVEAWYWYTFFDDDPSDPGIRPHENHFGLFGWPGDPVSPRREKPAWGALRALVATIGDARYAHDLSPQVGAPNDVYVLGFVDDAGRRFVAAWDGREFPDDVEGQVSVPNPATTWDLVLPLPAGTTAVKLVDLFGAELPSPVVADGTVAVTLDRSVRYLAIDPVPNPAP